MNPIQRPLTSKFIYKSTVRVYVKQKDLIECVYNFGSDEGELQEFLLVHPELSPDLHSAGFTAPAYSVQRAIDIIFGVTSAERAKISYYLNGVLLSKRVVANNRHKFG